MDPTGEIPRLRTGWKEIADFFRISIRTAQRWEHDGLPVRRSGTERETVFAYERELREWFDGHFKSGPRDKFEVVPMDPPNAASDRSVPIATSPDTASALDRPEHRIAVAAGGRSRVVPAAVFVLLAFSTALVWGTFGYLPSRPSGDIPAGSSKPAPDEHRPAVIYAVAHGAVIILDDETGAVLKPVRVPSHAGYAGLLPAGASAERHRLLIPTSQASGAVEFDLETGAFGAWYEVPPRTISRAFFSPDRSQLFVLARDALYAIRISNGEMAQRTLMGNAFDGLYYAPAGSILVLNRDSSTLSLFDPVRLEPIRIIALPKGTHDIVISPDGTRAFTTNEYADSVSCIALPQLVQVRTASAGRGPNRLAISSDGAAVSIANRDSNSVTILDSERCVVRSTIDNVVPDSRPGPVAFSSDRSWLYVGDMDRPRVVIYDMRCESPRPKQVVELPEPVHTIQPGPARRQLGRPQPGCAGAQRESH